MIINLILWVAGAVLIIVGIYMVQRPLARLNELRQIEANSQRYDAWRGGSRRTAADAGDSGRSGAALMQEQLRRRVYLWAGAIVVGFVLVVLGFAIH